MSLTLRNSVQYFFSFQVQGSAIDTDSTDNDTDDDLTIYDIKNSSTTTDDLEDLTDLTADGRKKADLLYSGPTPSVNEGRSNFNAKKRKSRVDSESLYKERTLNFIGKLPTLSENSNQIITLAPTRNIFSDTAIQSLTRSGKINKSDSMTNLKSTSNHRRSGSEINLRSLQSEENKYRETPILLTNLNTSYASQNRLYNNDGKNNASSFQVVYRRQGNDAAEYPVKIANPQGTPFSDIKHDYQNMPSYQFETKPPPKPPRISPESEEIPTNMEQVYYPATREQWLYLKQLQVKQQIAANRLHPQNYFEPIPGSGLGVDSYSFKPKLEKHPLIIKPQVLPKTIYPEFSTIGTAIPQVVYKSDEKDKDLNMQSHSKIGNPDYNIENTSASSLPRTNVKRLLPCIPSRQNQSIGLNKGNEVVEVHSAHIPQISGKTEAKQTLSLDLDTSTNPRRMDNQIVISPSEESIFKSLDYSMVLKNNGSSTISDDSESNVDSSSSSKPEMSSSSKNDAKSQLLESDDGFLATDAVRLRRKQGKTNLRECSQQLDSAQSEIAQATSSIDQFNVSLANKVQRLSKVLLETRADDYNLGDFMLNPQSYSSPNDFRYSLIIEKQDKGTEASKTNTVLLPKNASSTNTSDCKESII